MPLLLSRFGEPVWGSDMTDPTNDVLKNGASLVQSATCNGLQVNALQKPLYE
jgi:hypothetical protein